jgi:O-antigen/teichoic acid export membrane protein
LPTRQGMQKKFVTNLAFLLFLNLLIKPFWILGIDRAVQNTVGASSYGLYSALFNFSFLFNILLDVGITNFNNRNIAQHNHLLQKHLSGILVLRLVLSAAYFIVSFIIAILLDYQLEELWMLSVMLLNQALISFILYLRSNIAGLHLFRIDSLVSVLDRFIMIILCGVLLWGGITNTTFRIEWFIWAQTFAYAITAIFTFLILAGRVKKIEFKWDPKFSMVILKQSYPFAILILLMTFYNRIDSVMIERILDNGAEQAGIYAQAYRLLDSANMIAYLFSGLLLPMFSHMIKHRKPIEELAELSFSFIAVPAIMIIACGVFYANDLMGLLYLAHVEESATVFAILINCFLAISSVYIFGTLLTANGNLKVLNMIAFGGMILNITMNFILIPMYQAKGAAIASMTTQFITAGAQILLAHRIFKFKIRWTLAMRYLIFVFITFCLFYFTSQFNTWFIWRAGFGAAACFLLALLLKLIRPMELFKVIKYGDN